jgi:replicative DNA helicase
MTNQMDNLNIKTHTDQLVKPAEITGVPSGIPDLDRLTGGFQNSDFIVLGTNSSLADSPLCLQITRNASLLGYPTVIYSLKAPEAKQSPEKSGDFIGLPANPLYINNKNSITVHEIREGIRKLSEELKSAGKELKLIIIDQLSQIRTTDEKSSEREKIAEISCNLKEIAHEFELPLICLSRLSDCANNKTGKKPTLSDLQESKAIEPHADLIMLLHNSPNKHDGSKPEPQEQTEIILVKHRNGPLGEVKINFKGNVL